MRTGERWTEEEVERLRSLYTSYTLRDCAKLMNRSFGSVKSATRRFGILSGRTGEFEKGQVPFNKGLKQSDFMSEEAIANTKATRFKKGHKPVNYRPIGSERLSKDGYIEVKINNAGRWDLKHRIVWEMHNGEIPHGHCIRFKDGNKQNTKIDNLELISRAENMDNNTIHRYPVELKGAMRRLGKLNKTIRKNEGG